MQTDHYRRKVSNGARLPEERITHTAASIDAGPQPEPTPSPRSPRAAPCQAQPRASRQIEPPSSNPQDLFWKLPTIDRIAANVRRQPIGAILADICRDLGITRDHPLWNKWHDAITEYGCNFVRLVRDRLNRLFPIAHILARLKSEPAAPPAPASTGPPLAA